MKQREIKFRAWDGKRIIHNPICNDIGVSEYIETNINDVMQRFENTFVVVMQFTGLFDKNGKEIYEGDILENKSIETDEEDWEELGRYWNDVVVFCKGMFTTKDDGLGCGASLWEIISDSKGNITDVEVIGNIYENKELLK